MTTLRSYFVQFFQDSRFPHTSPTNLLFSTTDGLHHRQVEDRTRHAPHAQIEADERGGRRNKVLLALKHAEEQTVVCWMAAKILQKHTDASILKQKWCEC